MPPPYKNIVLADDDEDDLELFEEAVTETYPDLKVTVATDGAKLIKLLAVIPTPDVILLDLNMPCKSGKECLEEIRAKEQFDKVPVIILSTSDDEADINYCLLRGADNYYIKPYSFEGMKNIIVKICNGSLDRPQ